MGKPAPNLNRAARELPKPARNCCDLRTSPRVGVPLTREPRPPGLPQGQERGARGPGSPPRLSLAPAGARAGAEKAPLRLWRWGNCGGSSSKFA